MVVMMKVVKVMERRCLCLSENNKNNFHSLSSPSSLLFPVSFVDFMDEGT